MKKIIAMLTLICFMFALMPLVAFAVDEVSGPIEIISEESLLALVDADGYLTVPVKIKQSIELTQTLKIKDTTMSIGEDVTLILSAKLDCYGNVTLEGENRDTSKLLRGKSDVLMIAANNEGLVLNISNLTLDGGANWAKYNEGAATSTEKALGRMVSNTGLKATGNGTGVLLIRKSTVNLNDVILENNDSNHAKSAAINMENSTLNTRNTVIRNNQQTASERGGAIYIRINCELNMNTTEIYGNYNAGMGGGAIGIIDLDTASPKNDIYLNKGTVLRNNVTATSTFGGSNGGDAIFLRRNGDKVFINGGVVTKNGISGSEQAAIYARYNAEYVSITAGGVYDNNSKYSIALISSKPIYVSGDVKLDAPSNHSDIILTAALKNNSVIKVNSETKVNSEKDEPMVVVKAEDYTITALDLTRIHCKNENKVPYLDIANNQVVLKPLVMNGGTFTAFTDFSVDTLAEPVKHGYDFAGWYSTDDFKEENKLSGAPVNGTTYYAKWTDVSEGSEGTHIDHIAKPSNLDFGIVTYGERTDSQTFELTAEKDDNYDVTVGENHIKDVKVVYPFEASHYENVVTVKLAEKAPVGTYKETVYVTTDDGTVLFVPVTLEVGKANLTIIADDKTITVNEPLPSYTYRVDGLVKDDNLMTEPVITCQADGMTVGEYDIIISGADAGDNYNVQYVNGILKVVEKIDESEDNTTTTPSTSSGGGFSGSYNYPVNAADVEDATVTFSKNYAVAGDKVTITVTPDSGKQVDEVIVTDADGNVITVTKVGDNQYSFTMPAGKVNVAVTTKAISYDNKIVLQIGNQNVVVDGKAFSNDVAPVIQGDRTLVPIRVIVEALGGSADWNEATRTVTITIDGKVLTLVIDEMIPGFGQGATIMDSRTYVPIRYVAEYIGANVEWIAETQQIVILK